MASKYKAAWVAGELNTEFWNEVLVDRRIRTATYENGRFSVVLDTGEIVYFSGELGWDQLDMIAPAPAGPVGQKIAALEWDATGISALCLEVGRIVLDRETPGRLCIRDDPSEPPVDPAKEAIQRVIDAGLAREATDEEIKPIVAKMADEIRKEVDAKFLGDALVGMDLAFGPSKSFELTGKIEDGKLEVLSVKEIDLPPPTEEWITKLPSGQLVRGIPVQQIILDEAASFREVEVDTSGRPGTLDAPKPTEGYTRTCRTCGKAMRHQTWSSGDGAHKDDKYTCSDGHVEWVDGIDS